MKLDPFKCFLWMITLFIAPLTIACDTIEKEPEALSSSLSRITLSEDNIVRSEDAFEWQNTKHYKELVSQLGTIAEREFTSIIGQLISLIKKHRLFFQKEHDVVRKILQRTIFSWMTEDVLTRDQYDEENQPQSSDQNYTSDNDEEEDAWRIGYTRGYEGHYDSSENDENLSQSDSEENDSDFSSTDDDHYQEWQLSKLKEMFLLDFNSLDDFTPESIGPVALKRYLENHVERLNGKYSWLLHEEIEGTLEVSWDFIEKIQDEISAPKKFLSAIFGGTWFYYDWSEFDFNDPKFMEKTYIQTIKKLRDGKISQDIRKDILGSIHQMFTFNSEDFSAPFNGISSRYNEKVDQKDWRGALIDWSIYTTYRKIFENPSKRSKVKQYTTTVPTLPLIQAFNREAYLTTRLEAAYTRARETYTKVYPHPQTRYISYGKSSSSKRATLDIQNVFINLRKIGMDYESIRSKGKENIFVPSLYFIVSSQGNKKQFIGVPLNFPKLPKRALTRRSNDGIFKGNHADDEYYFDRVKHDVVEGSVLQGKNREDIQQEVDDIIKDPTSVNCTSQFVHSERVMMEFLRNKTYIQQLCKTLSSLLKSGAYKVHGVTLLGYSTNTICPHCTPTLVYLQNSRKKGEFLNLLISHLISIEGNVTFKPKGYDPTATPTMDWRKFRLNTLITAKINFDSQAHDLADEGQHSHTKINKAPKKTHNPHAKLFFPNDEISLSDYPLLEDGTRDPSQRFFYEFVGKDIHTDPTYQPKKKPSEKGGLVFSSGS